MNPVEVSVFVSVPPPPLAPNAPRRFSCFLVASKTLCSIIDVPGHLVAVLLQASQKNIGRALAVMTQRLPKPSSDVNLRSKDLVSIEDHLA